MLFQIGGKVYEVMINHKNGWNAEAFRGRYSEILERYDYIIGDWGYNQLRLKGMYHDGQSKIAKESQFSFTTDYITEHCNFGCAYFVLRKVKDMKDVKDPEEAAQYQDLGEIKEPVREYRVTHKNKDKDKDAAKEKGDHPAAKDRKEHRGRGGDRDSKHPRGERTQDAGENETKEKPQGHSGKKHSNRGERPNRDNPNREREKEKPKSSGGDNHQRNRKREERGGEPRSGTESRSGAENRSNGESRPQAENRPNGESRTAQRQGDGERPNREQAASVQHAQPAVVNPAANQRTE